MLGSDPPDVATARERGDVAAAAIGVGQANNLELKDYRSLERMGGRLRSPQTQNCRRLGDLSWGFDEATIAG